jgi:hypothetical protein
MKPDAHAALEQYRVRSGPLGSTAAEGNNGAFIVPHNGLTFVVIVSDGEGWDHVSISLPKRCPSWSEMCHFKDLFFEPHEVAMQLHPAESEYVNNHDFCLHIWRPQNRRIPTPQSILVGIR